jgi:hypothetical protein
MVLTPRIAGTHVVPAGGGKFAANSAVSNVEPFPVNELNLTNSLIYDGNSEFQYDHFDGRQAKTQQRHEPPPQRYDRRRSLDQFGRPFEQTQDRRINNSMLDNSSESFAAAFSSVDSVGSNLDGEPPIYRPKTSLNLVIDSYKTTTEVIYNSIPPRGKKISVFF